MTRWDSVAARATDSVASASREIKLGVCRKRHNLLRYDQRFTVTRDHLGNWHTYRPDGIETQ